MDERSQDILIITITTFSILTFICSFCQFCSIKRKIKDQSLTIALDQPAKLKRFKNSYFISLSHPRPLLAPPPSETTLYEDLTEQHLNPSAPLSLPATDTPPHSDLSERKEEEDSFIQSVDDKVREETSKEIKHLQATCEVLKGRIVKLERELSKLKQ